MSHSERLISFDWKHQNDSKRGIPACILSKTLSAAQRIINMIANEIEGRTDNERDRLSLDRSDKYLLYIRELRVGSAHSALCVGDPSIDALAPDDLDKVAVSFLQITEAVHKNDYQFIQNAFANKNRRIKALKAFKDVIPDPKTGIGLTIGVDSNSMVFDSHQSVQTINSFIQKELVEEDSVVAIGKLKRILFDKHEFQFLYAPTNKLIKVQYPEDIEEFLLKHPRNYIQISGRAKLDNNMKITHMSEVYMVDDVDLSPIDIDSFCYDNVSYSITKPFALDVTLDESEQLYCVCKEDIALCVASDTREGLIEDIHEKIAFLWLFYVETIIKPYGQDAEILRNNLMTLMEKNNE